MKLPNSSIWKVVVLFFLTAKESNADDEGKPRLLVDPIAEKCKARAKEFSFKEHNYFISSHLPGWNDTKVDWLDARNACREHCMDLVSMETVEENDLIMKIIKDNNIPYIWTSGRLCDFKGCDGGHLYPKNINGWFWSATRAKITATNKIPKGWGYNPWSKTGYKKKPQPDDAEFGVNQTHEACMAVLNNVYEDGINWHDVACYHKKPFICEDNKSLLEYIQQTNPGIKL